MPAAFTAPAAVAASPRVLVTGAGGFVGRHAALHLAAAGHQVVGLVRKIRPGDPAQGPRLLLVEADLAARDAPALPTGPFDAIVHCAAAIPARVADEAELMRINTTAMRRLLDLAALTGARRFIDCSSMAAFGRITTALVRPDTPSDGPSAYGRSKLACEAMLAEAARADRLLAGVSLRLPGVVGAGSHDNFLSTALARFVAGDPVTGRNLRAAFNGIVHVADLAGFFGHLAGSLGPGYRVVTMGARDPMPFAAVLRCLRARSGSLSRLDFVGAEPGFVIDCEPALVLGYAAPTVEDSLSRFVRDFLHATR